MLFLQAAVEDLPSELDGVADDVHVHFPWGSLLGAVAAGDDVLLRNLRRICSSGALLEVIIGLDPRRDVSELDRLAIPTMSVGYIDSVLAPRYRDAGFEIIERGIVPSSEWPKIKTSWAKRLRGSTSRSLTYIIGRATASALLTPELRR